MMNFFMTNTTHWNNIKPMLRCIALMVMVFLCLYGAVIAFQSIKSGQFANSNSSVYNTSCSNFIGIEYVILFVRLPALFRFVIPFETISLGNFSFFCFYVFSTGSFIYLFSLLGFGIFLITLPVCLFALLSSAILFLVQGPAFFAPGLKAFFSRRLFIKIRNGFKCLALSTILGYDCCSHSCFLSKRVWLEPVGSTILPIGSLYIKIPGVCQ